MRKTILILTAFLVTSCVIKETPIVNQNFDKIDFSNVRSFEEGKSCKRFVLGILPLPFGQPSLINAAKDGKLSKVVMVDYEYGFSLFPLPHSKKCLIAYGTRE